jgi:hypothetical protein
VGKMNILLISTLYTPDEGGGIGTYLYNLSKGLKELGNQVYIVTQTKGEDSIDEVEGIKTFRFKTKYLPKIERCFPGLAWSIFVGNKVERLVRELDINLIEFPNWEGAGFWYLLKKARKPVVIRLHTPYFETLLIDKNKKTINFGDKFICWLEKYACRISDCLTSSTYFHRDMVSNAYRLNKDEIEILPLGIIPPKLQSSELNNSVKRKIKVLYVSRLENRKGTLLLIQSIPEVIFRFPDIEFILIGKDRPHAPGNISFKEYFKKHYPQYKLSVSFLGYLSNEKLQKYYTESDIFVVPSLYESFGLIYVEALFNGKPIVACRAGGVPEVVEHDKTGLLIKPNDAQALSNAILTLCKNQNLREEMGKQAKISAFEKFHYKLMAKRTEVLYEQVIKDYCAKK